MNSLVMGKNSAVGMTLQSYKNNENYLFLDRNESESLLTDNLEFQRFLEYNNVQKVVYLMVDRTTEISEITKSKINYLFPIQIAEVISKFEDKSFINGSKVKEFEIDYQNILSFNLQRFTPSGCKDTVIKNLSLWQGLNSLVKYHLIIKLDLIPL